jgi:hypothetical protein
VPIRQILRLFELALRSGADIAERAARDDIDEPGRRRDFRTRLWLWLR